MEKSESIANLTKALISFRRAVGKIEFNQQYETTGADGKPKTYRYADLAQVKNKSEDALLSNGLVVTQPLGDSCLTTMLMHESGEYLSDTVSLGLISKRGVQEYGSVVTYIRRYSYCSILGLVSESDDDASAVDKKTVAPEVKSDTRGAIVTPKSKGNTMQALKKLKKSEKEVKGKAEIIAPMVNDILEGRAERDGKNANFIVAFINRHSTSETLTIPEKYLGTMDFALRAPKEDVETVLHELVTSVPEGVDVTA